MKQGSAKMFPPRPARPEITTIAAPKGFAPGPRATPVALADDAMPHEWLYACPVEAGAGEKLAAMLAGGSVPAAEALAALRRLPKTRIRKGAWPQFADAIDLKAVGGEKPELRSVYFTVVRTAKVRLVRVCHGAAGMNVSARMWVSGRQVAHGQLVRLGKGAHPVVVEAYHGREGVWLKWNLAHLAPRFTEVTAGEIDEVYRWRLSLWEAEQAADKADEGKLLAKVRIDPATVTGSEGFFRAGRSVNGRWWLIDPSGRAFYYKGVCGLNNGGIGGRRAHRRRVAPATVRQWIGLLKQWRFSGMGSWTTSEFFDKHLPYTDIIEGYYVRPWLKLKFPDPFDPAWRRNLTAKCRRICSPQRSSRDLVGYFLENERGFMEGLHLGERIVANSPAWRYAGPVRADRLVLAAEPKLDTRGLALLQFALSLDDKAHAFGRAWQFVLSRHGDLAALSKAWGVEIASAETIRQLTANEVLLISESYQADLYDFVKLWVGEFFRAHTEAIRRFDPNHLILGMRWGGTPGPAVLEAEKEWGQVLSRNNYAAEFYEHFDDLWQQTHLPILNGEYSTDTDSYTIVRNPIEPPGGYDPAERQAVRARQAMDRIFSHPGVVGVTKYRWHGRGDNLFNDGQIQWENVPALYRINTRAVSEAVRWDRPPRPPAGPLNGLFFVTLVGGTVLVDTLPAAREGDADSYRIRTGQLRIGLVCRRGKWDRQVYGDGIRGKLTEARRLAGGQVRLAVTVERHPTMLTDTRANARYTLELLGDGEKLEGTFDGTYDGRKTSGRAIGYCFRPAASVRL